MLKFIGKILIFILIILLLVFFWFLYQGYSLYNTKVEERPMIEYVEEIRANEHYILYEDINPLFFDAIVSIEDKRFFDHSGIDYFALGRILISAAFTGEISGGGSTITQQLSKNMYFEFDRDFTRKFAEIFMVSKLEELYSKEEILELYVNIINFGDNNFGIYQASINYYGVEPNELTLYQCATIAGITQTPSLFQLSNNNYETIERTNKVLEAMLENNKITQEEYNNNIK